MTGDATSAGPGGVTAGLPEYQAVLRAAKRPAELRKTDTTWGRGCTPQQLKECIYGSWYLLDTAHEKVLRGPEETERDLYAAGGKLPAGTKAVRVNPGTVLVQAHPVESASGKVSNPSPNSWYVLKDEPVLGGENITNPTQSNDESTGQPDVTFGFTSHGKTVWKRSPRKSPTAARKRSCRG